MTAKPIETVVLTGVELMAEAQQAYPHALVLDCDPMQGFAAQSYAVAAMRGHTISELILYRCYSEALTQLPIHLRNAIHMATLSAAGARRLRVLAVRCTAYPHGTVMAYFH